MPEYRLTIPQGTVDFFDYILTQEDEVQYSLTALNNSNKTLSQLDVVRSWRTFIVDTFKTAPDSSVSCWSGHYDQFGIVMLYLVEVSNRHVSGTLDDDFFRDIENYADRLLELDLPYSMEDRRYSRAWLSLIGHPDFVHFRVSRDRIERPNICNLQWLMSAAITRIDERAIF